MLASPQLSNILCHSALKKHRFVSGFSVVSQGFELMLKYPHSSHSSGKFCSPQMFFCYVYVYLKFINNFCDKHGSHFLQYVDRCIIDALIQGCITQRILRKNMRENYAHFLHILHIFPICISTNYLFTSAFGEKKIFCISSVRLVKDVLFWLKH